MFLGLQVQYKKEYEKNKAQSDYNTLPATENPLLRQLRYAGTILSDVGVWRTLPRKEFLITSGFIWRGNKKDKIFNKSYSSTIAV